MKRCWTGLYEKAWTPGMKNVVSIIVLIFIVALLLLMLHE